MIIGYYRREGDMANQFLTRISEVEKVTLLSINNKKDITQKPDYFIIGGAPLIYEDYWVGLKDLMRELPKTKLIIAKTPFCLERDIKEKIGHKNLEVLEIDSFLEKINELIDKVK